MPGIIGSTGWDRSKACTCVFSSTHSTTARSGGLWYRPTTSTTFSTKSGSVDSLNESVRWGFSSNLRQIRPIVDSDRPLRLAIEARDQCVAPRGASSSVAVRTSLTLSSRMDGGRPGRRSSARPGSRRSLNRPRHLATVDTETPSSAATCEFIAPGSAHASTILHRSAYTCVDVAARDPRTSSARSASVTVNGALGLPVLAIHQE
jgi:hypothetical protein